jgi:hypothetical protein
MFKANEHGNIFSLKLTEVYFKKGTFFLCVTAFSPMKELVAAM